VKREEEIKYWAGLAKYDFGVAQTLFQSKKYVYALFFAHLVVEKMLKALFVRINGSTPPPTHNLLRLAAEAKLELLEDDKAFLRGLMEFNIEARYPRDVRKVRKISTKKFT
jgi:HEPN domain-containing protein